MFVEMTNAAYVTSSSPLFWESMEFGDFVLLVISLFVLVSGILSIVFILYWGLLLILSWWKEDKIKPAINTIRYAVLGIVITVISIFVFPILWKLLWLDVEKYAQPTRILEKIEQIGNNIFWTTNTYNTSNSTNLDNIDSIPSDFSDL